MDTLLLSILIGLVTGAIDVAPMIAKKLPKSASISAFLQYLFLSIIIVNIDLPHISWWLEGGIISLMMSIPIVIIIAQSDKKSIPIIIANAIVLGTLISIAGFYLR